MGLVSIICHLQNKYQSVIDDFEYIGLKGKIPNCSFHKSTAISRAPSLFLVFPRNTDEAKMYVDIS